MLLPPALADLLPEDSLLRTVLALAPTPLQLWHPSYGPDGTTVVDFQLTYLNPAGQRQLGRPERPADMLADQYAPAQVAGLFAFYQHVRATGAGGTYEVAPTPAGRAGSRLAAQRSGAWLVVSLLAPTDLAPAAAAPPQPAAAPRELLRLFDQAPVALAVFRGPRYVVELANPAVCGMWGRTLAETLHTPLFELLPEAAGQGFEQLLDGVMATGVPYVANELPSFIDRAGRRDTVYWNFVYCSLPTAAGQAAGVTVVATEVTEQVLARRQVQRLNQELTATNQGLLDTVAERSREVAAAQAAVEHQRARLEAVFMAAPAAICIQGGAELVYELVNPEYTALFPGRQLLGQPVLTAVPEIAGHTIQALLRHVYETGETHQEQEMALAMARPTDGVLETRYFSFTYQARRDAGGTIDGLLTYAHEVTAQVLARQHMQALNQQLGALTDKLYAANAVLTDTNEQLGDSNEELTASNVELGDSNQHLTYTNAELDTFVYTASHDLQNPISNLDGLLQALREELPTECQATGPAGTILRMMQDSVVRFQRTLGHLAAIARLQAAPREMVATMPLMAVVEHVLHDLALPLAAAAARVEVDVTAWPPLAFSEGNLRSVVYNLLSNAVKYAHPDRAPHVHLRAYAHAGRCVLEVRDNGLGLSPAQQTQLFGLFQRLHAHVDGSGVGLYMVKKMVENAAGTIVVQSQLGTGTTFIVSLPGA